MPLEVLSSIKGAESSEAVNELFKVIKEAVPETNKGDLFDKLENGAILFEELRDDTVKQSRK